MSRPPSKIDPQLEASLRRFSGALEHNRSQYAAMVEEIMAATGAEVAQRITARSEQIGARLAERHRRRMGRWQRHDEHRRVRLLHGHQHLGGTWLARKPCRTCGSATSRDSWPGPGRPGR